MKMIERKSAKTILNMLEDSHIVYINGARQCGKSTLAMMTAPQFHMEYLTFDDPSVYAAAKHDPASFVKNIKDNMVLDEIQTVPEIFRCLKIFVDEQRRQRGDLKILLTGSANIMALPQLSDALVGRMQMLTLYPFSLAEFNEKNFITKLFKADFHLHEKFDDDDIIKKIKSSTFPEVSLSPDVDASGWFDAYVTTLLRRDIRELANIEKIADVQIILKILASRVGSLINESSLSRDCGVNSMTLRRYRILLENMFVIIRLFPWFKNIGKRLVKSTKNYFIDTLLMCNLLGIDIESVRERNPTLFGHILENFVFTELLKNSDSQTKLFHFRTVDNKEADFVLERSNGDLAGVEVKSAGTISANDFGGLKVLQELTGESFKCGVVLYLGQNVIPFGDKMFAVPMASLG
jgi:predicted AAA+ superfamily ATPase